MRPIVMRPIILAASVLAAACSDHGSGSPTAPSSAAVLPAQTQRNATRLPLRGSFTAVDKGVVVGSKLEVEGTAEGTATHLGRFTATITAIADLATPTATGAFTFTAANGDQLVATFVGVAAPTAERGVVSFTETFTIVGGTGRFVGATGTFTMRRIAEIDFAAGTSTSSGSFEGHIDLNK